MDGVRLFLPALFLNLLPLGYGLRLHETSHVSQIHVGHAREAGQIHAALIQGVKCLLHAVMAHVNAAGHLHHGAGLALRAAAYVADSFVSVILTGGISLIFSVNILLFIVQAVISFFS